MFVILWNLFLLSELFEDKFTLSSQILFVC